MVCISESTAHPSIQEQTSTAALSPLRVKSAVLKVGRPRPVFPDKRTPLDGYYGGLRDRASMRCAHRLSLVLVRAERTAWSQPPALKWFGTKQIFRWPIWTSRSHHCTWRHTARHSRAAIC